MLSSFSNSTSERRSSTQRRLDLLAIVSCGANRWARCFALSALAISISSIALADDAVVQQALPLETVVVSPAVQEDGLLLLQAPTNGGSNHDELGRTESVDADTGLRVAKRPWLLEKLVGPEKEKSVKMDAPRPPAAGVDPPSLSLIAPPSNDEDQWIARENQRADANPAETETRMPLTDVGIQDAEPMPNLRPLKIAKSKPLSSVDPAIPGETQLNEKLAIENTHDSTLSEPASDLSKRRPAQSNRQDVSSDIGSQPTPTIDFDYAGFPKQPFKLTRGAYQMRSKMHRCLRSYYSDLEIASGRSNWGMMHAMMVYGIDTKVMVDRRSYSTIAWIAGNNVCRGQRLFDEENGQIVVKSGVGLQGHDGQLLTVFSLCGVPASYPIYAGDHKFAVQDIVESEMLACKSGNELTFILIALSHYIDTDEQWLSAEGQSWDFERLIREELSQPVVGAACGGTHRLMGFGHALRQRRIDGKPITGQWERAEKFTEDFVQYVYRLQNRDGSFSTDWFEGREDNGELDRKVQTTGHMVEWLLTVTPDAQLQNPRLMSAVRFLLDSMYEERDRDWSIGPKGHALRSLAMFYDRVYQSPPPWQNTGVAGRSQSRSRR